MGKFWERGKEARRKNGEKGWGWATSEGSRIDWKRSLHRKGEGRLILYRRPPMPLRPRRNGRAYVG